MAIVSEVKVVQWIANKAMEIEKLSYAPFDPTSTGNLISRTRNANFTIEMPFEHSFTSETCFETSILRQGRCQTNKTVLKRLPSVGRADLMLVHKTRFYSLRSLL